MKTLSIATAGKFAKEWVKSGSPSEAGRWALLAASMAFFKHPELREAIKCRCLSNMTDPKWHSRECPINKEWKARQ